MENTTDMHRLISKGLVTPPSKKKKSMITTLLYRAKKTSDTESRHHEIQNVITTLKKNG